jgi:hypothetical protein
VRALLALALCVGCAFRHGHAPDDGAAGIDASDAAEPLTIHLGPGDGRPGTGGLTLTGTVTIDTGVPSISVTLPPGATLDTRPQLGGGPELAVLHVSTLTVETGAMVSIVGTRPLVIVADGAADIAGTLDAGAHGEVPGAGGALSAMGSGAGQKGTHGTSASDSGGGGAGFSTAGASGGAITGTCTYDGGAGGAMYGDAAITILTGGSGGGASSGNSCTPDPGGAGGGALQITSLTSITISGAVLAGGGGGHGGTDCAAADGDVNSGPGGGSGGAIVLQAPMIANTGVIAANGGGGGGSSSTGNGSANPGQDGRPSATAALGGTGPRAMGGSGGTGSAAPTPGGSSGCGTNGGGGGGAAGWIAASSSYTGSGIASPAANTSLPP